MKGDSKRVEQINIRRNKVVEEVVKLAREESRPLAQMATVLIKEALKQRGINV